ncbi:MAG: hypothetical protein AB1454_10935 [Candidatus Auribacterota bacterium]|jgi:hypothetical protein|uniref:Lipoprotein n=1 Tax=Candidatus Auribacter fodinae TaxID=2093366 RepID=A0A3A4QZA8_9BACT|nr:MAG: hypothetical protein C4541_08575 [Candidatus Auribacter fodinae]
MVIRILAVLVLTGFLTVLAGCAADPHQAAHNLGQPIGGALGVVQSVPEGAAEGYAGGTPERNPYGR